MESWKSMMTGGHWNGTRRRRSLFAAWNRPVNGFGDSDSKINDLSRPVACTGDMVEIKTWGNRDFLGSRGDDGTGSCE